MAAPREEKGEAVVVVESAAPGDVVILFVAHDGINHPDLWRRWLEGSAVRALSTATPTSALPAADWEVRGRQGDRENEWGRRSIVYATQGRWPGAGAAPRLGVVYMYRADIPIQSAETLCKRPRATCMRHARFRFATEAGLDALLSRGTVSRRSAPCSSSTTSGCR